MELHVNDIAHVIQLSVAIVFIRALSAVVAALSFFLREVYLGVSVGTHIRH